jgi:ionotropic glutamate receptor
MINDKDPTKNLTGNDRYMGYCVDLTKKIAQMLNFSYELRLVKDRKFGAQGY